jgi:hypothetical protein
MIAKRFALLACAVIGGAGCDLIVETGQTLVLADRGAAFGTGGNAQTAPLPAVRVQPGATLVVQDADVLGGGIVVQQTDQPSFGSAGAGIASTAGNGTVRVLQGLVSGGSVLVQAPKDPLDEPAPGIVAVGSSVEIAGGTIRGGSIVSQVGPTPGKRPAPAMVVIGGTVRVTGGTFVPGMLDSPNPLAARLSLLAIGSQLEIRGGVFNDAFGAIDGRTRVFGGIFESLAFMSSTPSGCSELRGGLLSALGVDRGRVIVAGTGLSLTPMQPSGTSLLTGTLENGQSVSARVVQRNGAVVQLVSPGSPGCP